jgi:pimeloyl-ACP methyl ester carboxylesterase
MPTPTPSGPSEYPVAISISERRVVEVWLKGVLAVPKVAAGVVLFPHGRLADHQRAYHQRTAAALCERGWATLTIDLLDSTAVDTREGAFNLELLAARLQGVVAWVKEAPRTEHLPLGLFSAGLTAAASLVTAARYPDRVGAVVCCGGRPDLANAHLTHVAAPTLLIVGSEDLVVLELNREAAANLPCRHDLAVVEGATHLFPEPGALEEVARLADSWYRQHLRPGLPVSAHTDPHGKRGP